MQDNWSFGQILIVACGLLMLTFLMLCYLLRSILRVNEMVKYQKQIAERLDQIAARSLPSPDILSPVGDSSADSGKSGEHSDGGEAGLLIGIVIVAVAVLLIVLVKWA